MSLSSVHTSLNCMTMALYVRYLYLPPQVRGVANIQDVGMLLYHLATKAKAQMMQHVPAIVQYILTKKLDSTLRVDKAIEYMVSNINNVNIKEFEMHCGVGIVVTPEEIEKVVEKVIRQHKEELLVKRYKFNVGLVLQQVRNELPWANGKSVKSEVDLQVTFIAIVKLGFVQGDVALFSEKLTIF